MNALASRLQRMERKIMSANPFEGLTDGELEAAIAAVRASIEAEVGMSEPELAGRFEKDLASGANTYDVDPHIMCRFVDQVKREYRHDA